MKMLKKFLKIVCIMAIILTNFSALALAKTAVVNTDTLRLRKEASTDSTIIALMDIGDSVEVLEEDGKWCKVKYIERKNGTTKEIIGYASSEFLKIGEGNVTPVVTETPKPQEDPTPVQEEPREEPQPAQEKPKEEQKPAENTEESENQETAESENKEEVKETKEEEKTEIKEEHKVNKGDVKAVSEEKDIYIVPLINALKINKVNTEDKIKVVQVLNGWALIETESGISGWIRTSNLV